MSLSIGRKEVFLVLFFYNLITVLLLCALGLLFSTLAVAQTKEPEACSTKPQAPELQLLLDLHNQTRSAETRCESWNNHSVPALRWSCKLARASKTHAQNMQAKKFLGHQGSDELSAGARAVSAGYQWRNVGENVAHGFISVENVYQAWLESRAHCNNIINGTYQELGAAKAGSYWVVMFGRQ